MDENVKRKKQLKKPTVEEIIERIQEICSRSRRRIFRIC